MTINKIIENITIKSQIKKQFVNRVTDAFQHIIIQELSQKNKVTIDNFGTFEIITYPSRVIYNPHNPSTKIVSFPKNVPKFRSVPALMREVKTAYMPLSLSDGAYSSKTPDLQKIIIHKNALKLVPEHIAKHFQIIPLIIKRDDLLLGMVDPEDGEAIEEAKKKSKRNILVQPISTEMHRKLMRQYKQPEKRQPNSQDQISNRQYIASLLQKANNFNAKIIHIEPEEIGGTIKFRLNSGLKLIESLDQNDYSRLIRNLKDLAQISWTVRTPQTGHFQMEIAEEKIDCHLSTFPTVSGEKILIHQFSKKKHLFGITQLGLTNEQLDVISDNLNKKYGIILIASDSKNGKTTTFYSLIEEQKNEGRNIITLEDLVTYRIPSVVQGQVDELSGLDLTKMLQESFTQDPDLIGVDSVLNDESAKIVFERSLIHQPILATISSNGAVDALELLINMGINPRLIATGLNVIIGQRLVKRMCDHCREPYQASSDEIKLVNYLIKMLGLKIQPSRDLTLTRSLGCDKCNYTGSKGYIGLFEILQISDDIQNLIISGSTKRELSNQAQKEGMISIFQDGIIKALQGETTLAEVIEINNPFLGG